MKKHVKIDENYFLTTQEVNSDVTVEVAKKTNHIFVVDVSGSMYYDLPLIRTQLKNKLSNIMKEGDTISIVWFSGRHDAGILKEEVEVKSLKTLSDLNDAIDKWLRPVGLTAFLKPLQLVEELVERIKTNRPDSVFSMIFLTDGYNNDCPWNEVISTLKGLEDDIVSSTFVEYGYYADTQKLTQMASVLGGEKISTSDFDEFEPVFDSKISSNIIGGKKIVVEVPKRHLYDFAFSVGNDGSVLLYNINYVPDGAEILVGSSVKEIHFFTPEAVGAEHAPTTSLYAAIYVLADKLLNDDAEKIFYALGDNHYYQMLANAFGKQKLNAFKNAIKECVVDSTKRFPAGQATIQKVADDAYCLMNLIEDLGNTNDCLFYPNHNDFNYTRIGRKRVARGEDLSAADKKRLAEAKDINEINAITKELNDKNVEIKFKNSNSERGYPVTDLVWNSERANLSMRIRIDGEALLPANNKFNIDKVSSYKYNTFTLVKDGIVNVKKLPVLYSDELYEILYKNKVGFTLEETKYDALVDGETYGRTLVIDLTSLPLVNRGMVKGISAEALAKKEWELKKLQGDKKVYDFYRKELFPKTSKSFVDMLGQECADWLKEIGITDYNGFAPKTDAEEATDFYMSVNLATKLKGLSSLPKVDVVKQKILDGSTLKINEWVMADALRKYMEQTASDMYQSLSEEQQKGVLRTYLTTKSDMLNVRRRKVLQEIAEIKFALILSKKWFTEFTSFDENTLALTLDEQDLNFTFDLNEKEVKV